MIDSSIKQTVMPRKKQADENIAHIDRPENGLENVNTPDANGAEFLLEKLHPITISATIRGVADLLMHKWNAQYVDEKSSAKKNSDIKKTDDPEMFISRTEQGEVAIPGEYIRMAIIGASKYLPDPRSPRKSMMDLMKAAFIVNEKLLSFGVRKWDYLDRRRVVIQRSGINRTRPAMLTGWELSFSVTIFLSEYIDAKMFHKLLSMAGQFIGLADFRPSFGRFVITKFQELKEKG
jgi:hypothetical protein